MPRKKQNKKNHKKEEKRILAILIGPPASGKSTYAQNCLNNYARVSQDDQGRKGHYITFLNLLIKGVPRIVVDRMNFSTEQRTRYIIPAKCLRYKIVYYYFDISDNLCLNRMRKRKKHPTVPYWDTNKHKEIIAFYRKNFSIDEDECHEFNIVPS